mmetsp:Transcript_23594/g.26758  ORF Transcript_23594/g.26758 Transcript_23594/m.26758 type:complete len:94 (+) Transcript_23594:563-844(+)
MIYKRLLIQTKKHLFGFFPSPVFQSLQIVLLKRIRLSEGATNEQTHREKRSSRSSAGNQPIFLTSRFSHNEYYVLKASPLKAKFLTVYQFLLR